MRTEGDRYLLDCGVKFHGGGLDYPAKVFDSRTVDAVFLSHAHLDHSGGLPFFEHYRMACPIFCTPETRSMVEVLLKDSHRIAKIKHLCESYEKMDVKKVFKDIRLVKFNEEKRFRTIKYTFLNAGHIPGSTSVKLEAEGMSLLYTGDYNTVETSLMKAANPQSWGQVGILITEATYGARDHPDRKEMQQALLRKTKEVVDRGGRVLIPVFAVGRAQEVLIMLAEENWSVPVYMDGMAKKITKVILDGKNPYVRDREKLRRLYQKIKTVGNPKHREQAAEQPGIFISTSGMLQGGPAMSYMEHIHDDPKSAVLMTGYQVKHTKGWFLDEQHTWKINGQILQVKCEVQRYDFSAHLSRKNIQEAILAAKPKIVIFNHGNPEAIASLTEWTRKNTKALVYAPEIGDQIDIDEYVSKKSIYTADDGYRFPEAHQHGETCHPFSKDIVFEDDD